MGHHDVVCVVEHDMPGRRERTQAVAYRVVVLAETGCELGGWAWFPEADEARVDRQSKVFEFDVRHAGRIRHSPRSRRLCQADAL
jgi:hypothetical protein